jgi:hypothetical protein
MINKEWLDKVVLSATLYNNQRLHTDFQEDEILKFVEWMHQQYGIAYEKPKATHINTPEKLQQLKDQNEKT